MALRDTDRYDVFVSHSGLELGYVLAEDENGVLQYFPGFVEEAARQQSEGSFGYDVLPNTISTIVAFEDWSGGCGLVQEFPGTRTTNRYSYSQGVDASWGDRLYLSPERQSMSGLTTSLTKIYVSPSQGIWGLGGRYVYKLSGTTWAVSKDLGVGKTATDIIEYGNGTSVFVVVAQGDSTDMEYTTNAGTSWSTATGNAFSYLTVRGSFSTVPVLWGITAAGYIKSSTNVTTFSNADRMGHTGETVNDLETGADIIWAFKREGIYSYDSIVVGDDFPARNLARTGNGANSYFWIDKKFYTAYGGRLIQFNPATGEFQTVFLMSHPELNGSITAITGTSSDIYFALKNTAGNTYIIKGNPILGVWHTWAYLGANDCTAMDVAPAGTTHSTRDALMFGYGTGASAFFILPIAGMRPEDDSAYRFDTNAGTIHGSLLDAGAMVIRKYFNSAKLIAASLSATRTAELKYVQDMSVTEVSILTAVQTGLSEELINPPVYFNRIRYVAVLDTGSNTSSPVVIGIAFDTTPITPRRREWILGLRIEDEANPRGGGTANRYSATQLLSHLIAAGSVQINYTDYLGTEFIAKLRTIPQSSGIKRKPTGKGRRAFEGTFYVQISEIQPTVVGVGASGESLFVWGASAWGGGDVWS